MLRTVIISTAILVIIYTGVLLAKSEFPFNTILLTIHKLVSLAIVVTIVFSAYKSTSLEGTTFVFMVLAVFFYLVSIITGGVVSAVQSPPDFVVWFHRIGAWIAIVTMILYAGKIIKI